MKHGVGGVMVWVPLSSAGVRELIKWAKSVNAAEFLQSLGKWLIPSIEKLFPDESVTDAVF